MNNFLIGDFEGPLDLLLHLVKQSKIEISEIKIVDITEQYINYLKEMEEMNLDILKLKVDIYFLNHLKKMKMKKVLILKKN